jgi:hypothetical protein
MELSTRGFDPLVLQSLDVSVLKLQVEASLIAEYKNNPENRGYDDKQYDEFGRYNEYPACEFVGDKFEVFLRKDYY